MPFAVGTEVPNGVVVEEREVGFEAVEVVGTVFFVVVVGTSVGVVEKGVRREFGW